VQRVLENGGRILGKAACEVSQHGGYSTANARTFRTVRLLPRHLMALSIIPMHQASQLVALARDVEHLCVRVPQIWQWVGIKADPSE